jgi:hypothetical protein
MKGKTTPIHSNGAEKTSKSQRNFTAKEWSREEGEGEPPERLSSPASSSSRDFL